ncbi:MULTISPECIES: exo-beta-N-acetylmuramidase NamZ domain-containing protein [unclassified Cellulophaga]|uniref:exo-beta-N-acetylmuramidase NamZ family protein n=1 Tax=unclassified Cellulophaga TaxID=2634405 RepID=UPI00351D31AB
MMLFPCLKNTFLLLVLVISSCGKTKKTTIKTEESLNIKALKAIDTPLVIAANKTAAYLPLLKGKNIAIVANQTSVIFNTSGYTHIVDSLATLNISIAKVFAPEHGFRGVIDAGEHVKDGLDKKTGLPLVSLYGKNRKPSKEQLKDIDLVLFDIQDVGVRFYTYIATLQLVMEACAEQNIPVIVLDRPNPNAHYVDGPTMESEHTSFLGMTQIPLVYGMTIGEYAQMINEEGWLTDGVKTNLTVVPMDHYNHEYFYSLPIRPSPNLPNDLSIKLYPSLGLFEGTDVNAGRGTEFQFQRYGAPFLDQSHYSFSYTPIANFGAKYPKHKGEVCFGSDLTTIDTSDLKTVDLQWIIDAYTHTKDKSVFFLTSGFTKHAGTEKLQKQIEAGMNATEIRETWQTDIVSFKKIRGKHLLYQ